MNKQETRRVVVVAGGPTDLWPKNALELIKSDETVSIGVDRGAFHLIEQGIVPEIAIGDFDSLSERELKQVESCVETMRYLIPEKDDTDTQLGVLAAMKSYPRAEIILLGATGGRLDHFLSNLWLALEPRFQEVLAHISLLDCQNTIRYFSSGTYTIKKERDKKYLAFVCFAPVDDLTLYDAKYTLEQTNVTRPISYSSNEFVGDSVTFSFSSGCVAVIQSKD